MNSIWRERQNRGVPLDEPPAMENHRLESLLGAVAEYLAHQYGLPHAPDWACHGGTLIGLGTCHRSPTTACANI
jgi:hypothetical protein